ncbi:ImmA/IrrE family metallo-endopeptidase [Staphylococcus pseudintermedius]|uniref:ImmA/IrrE family metallo-endopeptidase n=1 Tax=Staphylococcus pseudintermedius TaxID=283734 RepID=UPI0019E4F7E9|nr:ImmA/IrrE family metallo-endopeptidase [Staphylococcus pseudintermedius]EGQ1629933.1 ImmA/IrrE family metallo-endopeptidase [Staphylococcus pseudintermedius]EGQ1706653.1 ImmA/IrrE family metallo-endopeptidase [Staphylococcus pseudintermedius]EGQ2757021.1 ImmA/IrrE family metallo-endopeptidase [Staphylococcus pseudintermedius]EGQ2940357.1 ImmA/IrrE family metallo-endopeptidase [Staphylococcus pseudintermedius]EGQ2979499.1 ImmA/IrrE family metallo-endopeptidase [Staphylococcus pseudintermediu
MSKYEQLLIENQHIKIKDTVKLPYGYKGFYSDQVILIDDSLTEYKKHETLAEEIAHHKITYGNILDQSNMLNRKFELKARRLANESVISLQGLINAFNYGVQNIYDLALYFEVTKDFVLDTIQHYKQKYGLSVSYGGYIIKFEPLTIYKNI